MIITVSEFQPHIATKYYSYGSFSWGGELITLRHTLIQQEKDPERFSEEFVVPSFTDSRSPWALKILATKDAMYKRIQQQLAKQHWVKDSSGWYFDSQKKNREEALLSSAKLRTWEQTND